MKTITERTMHTNTEALQYLLFHHPETKTTDLISPDSLPLKHYSITF